MGNMRKWLFAGTLAVSGALFASQLTGHELCEGFLPDNDMSIPLGLSQTTGGLTEQDFNDVLDQIEALYQPEVAAHGGNLAIIRHWEDSTVNASAMRMGKSWQINMFGGLARHPAVTKDGFALVACHEMGHHLGGAPKVSGFMRTSSKWASNEGASDYYATLKCLRRLFEKDDNEKIVADMDVDATVAQACEAEHGRRLDQLLCIRGAMAGMSVSGMFNDLTKNRKSVSFTTPDTSQVRKTSNKHPAAQCRLDTYFAGAVCKVSTTEALSDQDYRPGSCADASIHARGLRPRCWFKPDGSSGGGGDNGPWG